MCRRSINIQVYHESVTINLSVLRKYVHILVHSSDAAKVYGCTFKCTLISKILINFALVNNVKQKKNKKRWCPKILKKVYIVCCPCEVKTFISNVCTNISLFIAERVFMHKQKCKKRITTLLYAES